MPKKKNQAKQASTVTSKAPAATGTKTKKYSPPKVEYKQDGSCLISHSEYVGDIDGIPGGAELTFPLNPQDPGTFTWLSAIATRFEMFRFKRLEFTYKPSCSTANEGYIVLGFDFDAYDDFPTKNVMLAWKYSSKSAVWQQCSLNCTEDARISTFRYCGVGNVGDSRLDRLGNLFVIARSATTLSLGELFVNYQVEFRQPSYKLPPAVSFRMVRPSGSGVMPSNSQFWVTGQTEGMSGNAHVDVQDQNTIRLYTPGEYKVDLEMDATANLTGHATINATQPTNSPSSNFFLQGLEAVGNGATKAIASYVLKLITGPVDLNFGGLSGGNDLQPTLFLSTYFSDY